MWRGAFGYAVPCRQVKRQKAKVKSYTVMRFFEGEK
jgi:hypothetical protein